jgi:hypothetical protein
MSERRSYTKEQREEALADVVTMGVAAAARKLGAPQSCVSRWAADAGVRRATPPARSAARTPKTRGSGSKAELEPKEPPLAFWSWKGVSRYTALLTELGIDHLEAAHEEWNGNVEVFNANLHKELFDAHRFYDLAEMRRRLAAHLHWYNHARTHHALGGLLVPADRYYGRVDEVLARIEAGAGRDVNDLLDLRERGLELFKVTSKGGVAEVWLLGQRLLEVPTSARP